MRHRLILLLGLAAPSLMADPPARVGRLNLIQGTVSFRASGVDEWAIAQPNRPLTTGDRLWTDESLGPRRSVQAHFCIDSFKYSRDRRKT